MKHKKSFLIVCLIICLFSIASVCASDANDTIMANDDSQIDLSQSSEIITDNIQTSQEKQTVTQIDNEEMIGTTDDGTFTALQNKIANAEDGATITLENDYSYDESCDDGEIELSKSITINGNGHTINALSKSGIFLVFNGYEKAISVSILNVNFYNAGGGYWGHGAIDTMSYKSNLTVKNCVFDNNKAGSYGGAINWDSGNLIVKDCVFNNNEAHCDGGAIYASSTNLTVQNCVFNNNKAESKGGAIYADCFYDESEDVIAVYAPIKFYIYFYDILIKDSNFTNNEANQGGAIYARPYLEDPAKYAYAVNCIFGGNEAVLYKDVTGVTSTNCIFKNTELFAYKVTATYGVSKKLVVTLKDAGDNALKSKKVTVKVGTISKTLTTNNDGQVSVDVSKLTPKTYTATLAFGGDNIYIKSTCSVKVTVKKATPKFTAKTKTFKKSAKTKKYTVTLKVNNKVMKKTLVTLKVNKKTYKVKTNNKGQATFKITNLKKKGKYTATVKYAGSKYYNAKTVKPKITIK